MGVPNEKGFRWLFDGAVDAMLLVDPEGAILAANASCGRIFGYAPEEWAGMAVEDLLPRRFRSDHRGFRAAFAANPVARGMGRGVKIFGLRKEGSEFPAKVSLSALRNGPETLVLAVIHDLGALQEVADNPLLQGEQAHGREVLLGLAVRATGLAPWEWNPHTDEADLSPEWKAQLGYGNEELPSLADEWRARLHPDEAPALTALATEFRTGRRRDAEFKYRLRHRDGDYRWMKSRCVLVPTLEGRPSRLLGVQWDVTEEVDREQRLAAWRKELDKLRQLRVVHETTVLVAHGINQPLNAVMSYCEAAHRMWMTGRTEQLANALASAVTQTERAGQVVRDLLVFLEHRELPCGAVDLKQAIGEAAAIVAAYGGAGGCTVEALGPDLPPVLANPIYLKKVLVALLNNAVEAIAGAGLPCSPITVRVGTAGDGAMAWVSVHDRGPGLDPAAAEHLFEPFFTTKPDALGMGLATSRRIIERLGGQLWFEAGAGPGATFHFTVPFAK